MKSCPGYVWAILGISFLAFSCSQKVDSPSVQSPSAPASKESYIGNWKLSDTQGNTYYMSLDADGSGKTTRGGGEFGKWEFKQDHIEAEWIPKNLKLYFDPGKTKPLLKNPSGPPEEISWGVKVNKIPE